MEAPKSFMVDQEIDSKEAKCPLCCITRKSFHCATCISTGDFKSSINSTKRERFRDKLTRFKNLKVANQEQNNRYKVLIQEHKRNEDLRIAIAKKVKKVCIINKLIKETQENYKNLQHIKKANHDENRALRIILPKYEEKVNKLGDFVAGAEEKNDGLRGKCLTLEDQLKLVRRNYIGKLLQYIFPISQTLGTSTSIRSLNESKDQTELMQRDTENELAEAIKLAFVRGKWISQNESMTELQYVIVAPSLPSNGDYTAYSDWIFSQNKDMPNATTTSGTGSDLGQNPAYRISAALTYTTQLVQVLSYYLDQRTPYKISYSDYCTDMNENQFQRRVARLNSAVLYLCYSQSIKLKDVNPTHTLENINLLLNTTLCDLGRIGFVDPSNIDSQNLNDLMTEQNSDSEDENNLPQEWETIQHVMDMPSPSSMLQQQPAVNQSSMAGQMLQTAQSSIASFWKGWTK